jgi:hypothetical protein
MYRFCAFFRADRALIPPPVTDRNLQKRAIHASPKGSDKTLDTPLWAL